LIELIQNQPQNQSHAQVRVEGKTHA